MKKLVVFNWKMNPSSFQKAKKLFDFSLKQSRKLSAHLSVVIAPPFVYLEHFFYLLNSKFKKEKGISLAAQNVSFKNEGSFTGEISAKMLKDIGVSYVIVGHSERRYLFGENDSLIAEKIKRAWENKITPILCVGEKKRSSFSSAWSFVRKQIEKDLVFLKKGEKNLVIAYEPVWSIGGNKPVDPLRASLMIEKIKSFLKERFHLLLPVLYGGSVDCQKIDDFLKYSQIDGFLVGSASLSLREIKCLLTKVDNF